MSNSPQSPPEPLSALSEPIAGKVRAALEQAGLRYTRQRGLVYAYLHETDRHPTAEDVYQAVRRQMPKISLGTVYTGLEALVRARLANRLSYGDGSARYDCRREEHYHLRDVATGEVRDLPTQYDPALLDKLDPELWPPCSKRDFTSPAIGSKYSVASSSRSWSHHFGFLPMSLQLGPGASIRHVGLRQPGPTSLQHAIAASFQSRSAERVGGNDDGMP